MRERINSDSVGGAVVLLLTLAFWLERSYANPLAGHFPDFVLVLLTLMSVVLTVRGILKPPTEGGAAEVPQFSRLTAAVVLLAVWVFLLAPLGFLVGGVVMFLTTSLYLRGRPIEVKGVLMDAAISLAVVVLVHAVFTRLLNVSLPPGPF